MDTIAPNLSSKVKPSYKVETLDDLAAVYQAPKEYALTKQTDHITAPGRAFIEAAPFVVMATATADGIDCSPKGDAPGFIKILDERTLLIPDRPGNNRIDGMKNLIANPKIGLIFMVPGADETYRVNGTAIISTDPDLMAHCEANGKLPRTVIVVTVEEAFNHCSKAFARSKLWSAGTQGRPDGVPTGGTFAAHRDGGDADYARRHDRDYAKRMPGELY